LPPHAASAAFFIAFRLKLSLAALAVKRPERPFPRSRRAPAIAVSTGAGKNYFPHYRRPKKKRRSGGLRSSASLLFKNYTASAKPASRTVVCRCA
jgi:hypothetical protein